MPLSSFAPSLSAYYACKPRNYCKIVYKLANKTFIICSLLQDGASFLAVGGDNILWYYTQIPKGPLWAQINPRAPDLRLDFIYLDNVFYMYETHVDCTHVVSWQLMCVWSKHHDIETSLQGHLCQLIRCARVCVCACVSQWQASLLFSSAIYHPPGGQRVCLDSGCVTLVMHIHTSLSAYCNAK